MRNILILFFIMLLSVSNAFAEDMRFIQITDVRYSANSQNNLLESVIKDINKQKDVEFVVFTGDNINKPTKEDLEAFLAQIKKLNVPFYIVFGDKDVNKLKEMGKADYIKLVKKNVKKYKPMEPNFVFEKNGVFFIAADGSKEVIPATNGFYKDNVVEFVDNELSLNPDKNAIILQHFPLIPPSNREAYYTFRPENYLKMLKKHNNVKAIISGHFGVNSEKNVDGILHITTAGLPYYRVIDILDYDTSEPTIWAELRKCAE